MYIMLMQLYFWASVDFTKYFEDFLKTIINGIIGIVKSFFDMITAPVRYYFHTWDIAANSSSSFGVGAPIVYLLVILITLVLLLWFGKKLPIVGEFLGDDE